MTRTAACLAAVLALAGTGCASMRARQVRAERLRTETDALRYAKPIDDVWQEVRRLLTDGGYPLAGADAKAIGRPEPGLGARLFSPARETHPLGEDVGLLQRLGILGRSGGGPSGRALETGWRLSGDRYRADAIEEDGAVRVVLTRFVNDGTERPGRPARDPELEFLLARRLDPEAAARIDAALASPPQ